MSNKYVHKKLLSDILVVGIAVIFFLALTCPAAEPTRIKYNNPGLIVDLGVGLWAWPLPLDYDADGDNDLLVSCSDTPYNGMYFFENIAEKNQTTLFAPAVKIAEGFKNIQICYIDGKPRILLAGKELVDFVNNKFGKTTDIYPQPDFYKSVGKTRAEQWKYVDYDNDGKLDLVAGVGFWHDYGWDNAFDQDGNWTNGPLHGYVYLMRNKATTAKPEYEPPVQIQAGGKPIDTYGMPSPSFADFDNDGDLDLICGNFVDKFYWFENTGTREKPVYAASKFLTHNGQMITMDLEMIVPTAIDWDNDGNIDIIVGQEDGRVALMKNTGKVIDNMPQFELPFFFRQQADEIKFGALVTPYSIDWDSDGDEDLICGNTAGYIGFIENLSGGTNPRWAEPVCLEVDGKVIHIQAGEKGSIQGPAESKWGYTTLSVADWDGDGLNDIMINSIWCKIMWYRNIGTKTQPKLAAAQPVLVDYPGQTPYPQWNWWKPEDKHLVTQWRTTPLMYDLNKDGLMDLVMLDQEGYLAYYERKHAHKKLILMPGKRIFYDAETGKPLQLNPKTAGRSGRRKICLTDWDMDGKLDLLANSKNVDFYQNVKEVNGKIYLLNKGQVSDKKLAGHTTSPTTVDWDNNNIPDLLIGAEDGYLYYMQNPKTK